MRGVVILPGPTGTFEKVNIFTAPTGPVGLYETCVEIAPGDEGPTGTFQTVCALTVDGPTAGFKTIIVDGYTP